MLVTSQLVPTRQKKSFNCFLTTFSSRSLIMLGSDTGLRFGAISLSPFLKTGITSAIFYFLYNKMLCIFCTVCNNGPRAFCGPSSLESLLTSSLLMSILFRISPPPTFPSLVAPEVPGLLWLISFESYHSPLHVYTRLCQNLNNFTF